MSKDRLKNINTCAECVTKKKDCPYPGAWNSKELAHLSCDEAFKETKRITGNHTGRREYIKCSQCGSSIHAALAIKLNDERFCSRKCAGESLHRRRDKIREPQ